jgi:WD40 repeat protein
VLCTTLLALAFVSSPRLDADGLPLPADALRRFGSLRWYADPPRSVAFSPDGKVAYLVPADKGFSPVDRPPAVSAWELATGRPLWAFAPDHIAGMVVTADPDGKTVWVAGRMGVSDRHKGNTLPQVRVKLDAATGKELARKVVLRGWLTALDLRPDGTMAWNRYEEKGPGENDLSLRILKPDGTERAVWDPDGTHAIDLVKFAPDGKTVFVAGPGEGERRAKLVAVDPDTGKTRWAEDVPGIKNLAVSPDGKTLAVLGGGYRHVPPGHNDSQLVRNELFLHRVDSATGRSDTAVKISDQGVREAAATELAVGFPLTFTADGSTVLVATDRDGRKAVSVAVAEWKKSGEVNGAAARGFVTPDGQAYLAPTEHGAVALFDVKSHAPLPHSPSRLRRPRWWGGCGVSFADNGRRVRYGRYEELTEWEVTTGRETAVVPWEKRKHDPRTGVVDGFSDRDFQLLSPDGNTLFQRSGGREKGPDRKVGMVDAESLKRLAEVDDRHAYQFAFSPDSKHLIGTNTGGDVYFWDVAKGGRPLTEVCLNSGSSGGAFPILRVAGTWAAVSESNREEFSTEPQRTWSISRFPFLGFKREKTWKGKGAVEGFEIVPGSGIVGTANVSDGGNRQPTRSLFVIDPGADAPREYPLPAGTGFAVSPDGRTVAFGVGSGDIHLYETATGKLRHTLRGLRRPAVALAFSPDGTALASESADGPVILWDVASVLSQPAERK